MRIYEVSFVHVVERTVTCSVEASSEEEALEKVKNGEYGDSDEEFAPEEGIETKNYRVLN